MNFLKLTVSPTATHYLFLRKHQASSSSSLPEDRTLFLANVPVDSSHSWLEVFFSEHGCSSIESIEFSSYKTSGADTANESIEDKDDSSSPHSLIPPLPAHILPWCQSGDVAHVVFQDPSSIDKVLSLAKSDTQLKWPPSTHEKQLTGLARYISQYNSSRLTLDEARRHADSFMDYFDAKQAAQKQQSKYKAGDAIVDEDGWTLVKRGGTFGRALGGSLGIAKGAFIRDAQRKGGVGPKRISEFYRHQRRERKQTEFVQMKQKFENEKRRVEGLKKSRRFKPY
ncbi:ribosomal RNA-processing protein 7-domain-containing protein [Cantharellus anzutake]|uniref:ribosomal RNA-processing protein 7-domain-containing protein n=1 Tax=Cantharellus anzutake TaxID=1750568 RepID=UPI001907BEE1|nr:ribosomal RNA-processing protein 7-domain-containing protein [Cantharellus anzutake]KAF8329817.1 ribosomal RNA-processing protein 7-domain-containing protein [Cantharellus anzutake]